MFRTLDFEKAWVEHSVLRHAHFVNSATSGLQLAVRMLREKHQWHEPWSCEVITTPLTFVSTNHAILHGGLRPVMADVDESMCLSAEEIEKRITKQTRAVMYVGVGGNSRHLVEVERLCRIKRLPLIVDAAHLAGARDSLNRKIGVGAAATVFSFHSVKNLPTADSGMVCFAEDDLDTQVRKWSWLGIDKDTYSRTGTGGAYAWKYDVPSLGFKHHGNSIMAAMGLVALRYLDQDNAERRRLAYLYDDCGMWSYSVKHQIGSCRHLYQIRVANREEVIAKLHAEQIFPGVHYRCNTDYPMYASQRANCPNAVRYANEVLSLPLHLRLSDDDVRRVSEVVLKHAEPVADQRCEAAPVVAVNPQWLADSGSSAFRRGG